MFRKEGGHAIQIPTKAKKHVLICIQVIFSDTALQIVSRNSAIVGSLEVEAEASKSIKISSMVRGSFS